ncbi:hypothetical protein UlMin_023902 [Ulmus minor]
MEGLVSFQAVPTISHIPKFLFSRSIAGAAIDVRRGNSLSVTFPPLPSSSSSIRVQQDGLATVAPIIESESEPEQNDLKVKEWEVGMFHNEVAASQGIRIRRMPPTRPPLHYVGPFEFRLQNEGNTLCNILEEIIWHKDKEVAHLRERKSLGALKKALDNVLLARDFVGALKSANARIGLPGLIAKVKKASRSRGIIREDFDPVEIARAYEKGGAACLGVLADEKYFQGSFDNIKAIRNAGVKYGTFINKNLGLMDKVHEFQNKETSLTYGNLISLGIDNATYIMWPFYLLKCFQLLEVSTINNAISHFKYFVSASQPLTTLANVFDGFHYGVSDFAYVARALGIVKNPSASVGICCFTIAAYFHYK